MNVILITGASSGLGNAFAKELDKGFSNVDEFWLLARNKENLKKLAEELHHNTRILEMDVTDEYAMDDLAELLESTGCQLCMLINCAGYGLIGDFYDLELEPQLGMITTNCEALTRLTWMCLPFMKRNGRVIQLASSAGFLPQPGFAVYAATKAYVLSFSRAMGEEMRQYGVYVTTVCPGPVDTPFFQVAEQYGKGMSFKKWVMADPEKVVRRALRDSYHKKRMSVYSFPIKALEVLAKVCPTDLVLHLEKKVQGAGK